MITTPIYTILRVIRKGGDLIASLEGPYDEILDYARDLFPWQVYYVGYIYDTGQICGMPLFEPSVSDYLLSLVK